MSQYWDALAARSDGMYTPEDFESTAYRLIVEQALYYADRNSRTAYWILDRYEHDFRRALAPLGIKILVNRRLQYAVAMPTHAKIGSASTAQTIFALVLRLIYDSEASKGQFNDNGEVICFLDDLDVKYRELTGRDFPSKGDLDSLMKVMKRWGLAKISFDDNSDNGSSTSATDQPYAIIIRPGIIDLLGEAALQRLVRFKSEIQPDGTATLRETDSDGSETTEAS